MNNAWHHASLAMDVPLLQLSLDSVPLQSEPRLVLQEYMSRR